MDEPALRDLVAKVKVGTLTRRAFVQKMVALGLPAPMAGQVLRHCGVAKAEATFLYKPTKRGGGGTLKLLWWQAPTLLNPHFAVGTKDQEGSRIFYEPLAAWDADGDLRPVLAAEIPSRENGGLAADGLSVTWKIKRDVIWHDGKPFTADDLVFNWEYASDPETASVSHHQQLSGRQGPETRRLHGHRPVRQADTFLGRCLCRHARHAHPQARVCSLHETYRAAESELDPVKRAALFIRLNDLACSDHAVIPVVYRPRVIAMSNKLHAPLTGWDNDLWALASWYRDA